MRNEGGLIFIAHCKTLSDKGFHTASLRRSRRRLRQSQTTPKAEIATAPRGPRNDDSGCVAIRGGFWYFRGVGWRWGGC